MTTVNINRKITDSYYRYKMPKVQAKVEGRGNGIKTVVANLSEVSKALNRPPLYPLKYMGCELGAQTIGDVKNDRFIINGAHDAEKLQNILDTFIEKYVLCVSCSNPETVLSVQAKKETITMRCKACGHTCKISTVHRASTYILKNPPTKSPKNKSITTNSTGNGAAANTSPSNTSTTTTTTTTTTSNINNTNGITTIDENEPTMFSNNDDHDECQWNADVSEAAVRQRQQLLSSHLRSLTLDDDTHKPIHEKLEILREFIQHKLSINNNLSSHFDDILDEVKRLDIEHKAIFAISSVIFDSDLVNQLSLHHHFLRHFCFAQPKVQKYLLASIERIIEEHMDELIDKVPIIFKIMFEAEIIDEEVFLGWDAKRSSRFVSTETSDKIKNAAFKFMDWLKNAEEESSDGDGNGDDDDDGNGDGSKQSTAVTSTNNTTSMEPVTEPITAAVTQLQSHCNGYATNSGGSNLMPVSENDKDDGGSDINIDDI